MVVRVCFFSSRRRHTRYIGDWSSDVCSSDLAEGYRIMTYTDGASALDGFKTSPPDLAILDIKMPRMDGMETLRRLRQKSDMPVIFLTSKDEEIDELFGLKMGADDFIRKPFSQRLLVER